MQNSFCSKPKLDMSISKLGFRRLQRHHSLQFDAELEPWSLSKCLVADESIRSKDGKILNRSKSMTISDIKHRLSVVQVSPTEGSSLTTKHTSLVAKNEDKSEAMIGRKIRQKRLEKLQIPINNSTEDVQMRRTPMSNGETPERPKRPFSASLGMRYSSINKDDLQEALRSLRTPTIVPECIWDAHRQRLNSMKEEAKNGAKHSEEVKVVAVTSNSAGKDITSDLKPLSEGKGLETDDVTRRKDRRILNRSTSMIDTYTSIKHRSSVEGSMPIVANKRPLSGRMRIRCTGINKDDVQEALRSLKTPTIVPECIRDAHRQRLNSMKEETNQSWTKESAEKGANYSRDCEK